MEVFVPSWCDNLYECRGEVRQEREQDYAILVQHREAGTVDFVFYWTHCKMSFTINAVHLRRRTDVWRSRQTTQIKSIFVRHPWKSEQGNSKLLLVSASSTSVCCRKVLRGSAMTLLGSALGMFKSSWRASGAYCHFGERTFIERRVVSRLLMTMLWQGLIRRIASLDSAVTNLLVLQLGRSSVEVKKKIKMNDEIIEGQGDGPDTTQKTKWADWDSEVRRSIMLSSIKSQRNAVQSLMQAQIRRCLWTRGVTGRSRSRDREIKIATEVRTNAEQWSRMWKESRILQLDRRKNKLLCELRSCRNGRQGGPSSESSKTRYRDVYFDIF